MATDSEGQVRCVECSSSRFRAGEIELSPGGGFDVVMPCAECGTPNTVFHDEDPEMARTLLGFFAANVS